MNEELKTKCVAFVLALGESTLTDTDVAWQGAVTLALPMFSTDPDRAKKMVERLQKLAGKPS